MRIDAYSFGKIVVDGESYQSDVIVFPDRVMPHWRRRQGHSLCLEDLAAVLDFRPRLLILGTGAMGAMRVPAETLAALGERGMEVVAAKTSLAVERFNREADAATVAALHLTC